MELIAWSAPTDSDKKTGNVSSALKTRGVLNAMQHSVKCADQGSF